MNLKDQAKDASKQVITIGITTVAMALGRWIISRPIKRAIARRRAKQKEQGAE